jgi:hypothetical protein
LIITVYAVKASALHLGSGFGGCDVEKQGKCRKWGVGHARKICGTIVVAGRVCTLVRLKNHLMDLSEQVSESFVKLFGDKPSVIARAPGTREFDWRAYRLQRWFCFADGD